MPYFIGRIDIAYEEKQESLAMRFKNGAMPSDFMRSNVYHSFQEDALGIQMRHVIGVENLMWGSDYPHSESTFPKSLEILDEYIGGCTGGREGDDCGRQTRRGFTGFSFFPLKTRLS